MHRQFQTDTVPHASRNFHWLGNEYIKSKHQPLMQKNVWLFSIYVPADFYT